RRRTESEVRARSTTAPAHGRMAGSSSRPPYRQPSCSCAGGRRDKKAFGDAMLAHPRLRGPAEKCFAIGAADVRERALEIGAGGVDRLPYTSQGAWPLR